MLISFNRMYRDDYDLLRFWRQTGATNERVFKCSRDLCSIHFL